MQRYGSTSILPNGGWSSSGTQNIQASIGQYSIHAGDPAQPVQQSVVIASILGRFLRVAFPSPSDIGHCLSTMSNIRSSASRFPMVESVDSNIALRNSSTICVEKFLCLLRNASSFRTEGYQYG